MGETIRFGVSLDSDLLEKFDALCEERCYQTRSEAIRDLIRNTDRKSTRLNSSHYAISYAVFCLKKKTQSIGIIIKRL